MKTVFYLIHVHPDDFHEAETDGGATNVFPPKAMEDEWSSMGGKVAGHSLAFDKDGEGFITVAVEYPDVFLPVD